MQVKERTKNYIYIAVFAVSMVLLLACELFKVQIFGIFENPEEIYSLTTRAIGSVICLLLVLYCSYQNILKLRKKNFLRSFIFILPCLAVAINNFPIINYFSGKAYIEAAPSAVAFFAVQCLFVGLFEEMAFRGAIFMLALQKHRKSKWDVFFAIVIASAVFGAIHLVNVFAGASFGSVILQIGYSFLIGGMCSVVLMKTGCIWYCVLIHAIYNFCGGVVPELGGGVIWDIPTIVLTAVVAVAVAVYIVVSLIKINPNELGELFGEKENTPKEVNDADL